MDASSCLRLGWAPQKNPGRPIYFQAFPGSFYHGDPVGIVPAGLLAFGSSEDPPPSPRGGPREWPSGHSHESSSPITAAGPPRNFTVFRDAGDINGFEELSLDRPEGDVKRFSRPGVGVGKDGTRGTVPAPSFSPDSCINLPYSLCPGGKGGYSYPQT